MRVRSSRVVGAHSTTARVSTTASARMSCANVATESLTTHNCTVVEQRGRSCVDSHNCLDSHMAIAVDYSHSTTSVQPCTVFQGCMVLSTLSHN